MVYDMALFFVVLRNIVVRLWGGGMSQNFHLPNNTMFYLLNEGGYVHW